MVGSFVREMPLALRPVKSHRRRKEVGEVLDDYCLAFPVLRVNLDDDMIFFIAALVYK